MIAPVLGLILDVLCDFCQRETKSYNLIRIKWVETICKSKTDRVLCVVVGVIKFVNFNYSNTSENSLLIQVVINTNSNVNLHQKIIYLQISLLIAQNEYIYEVI